MGREPLQQAPREGILKETIVKLVETGEVEVLGPAGGRRRRQDQVGDQDVMRPVRQMGLFRRR